jgi:hypothetical protein
MMQYILPFGEVGKSGLTGHAGYDWVNSLKSCFVYLGS